MHTPARCGHRRLVQYREELAPWGIRVVLVEPASIHTDAVDKLARDAERTVDAFTAQGRELYGDSYTEMINVAIARGSATMRATPPSSSRSASCS